MQGLGNDFIVIDDLNPAQNSKLTPKVAIQLCDRRFGIGADQILWLRPPQDSTCTARMEILNSDGSIAEMCGNGIRAVAIYLAGPGNAHGSFQIETLAGIKTVNLKAGLVDVDMGPPVMVAKGAESIEAGGVKFQFYEVSMGNPHAVIFTDNLENIDLAHVGPLLESHPRFPNKANIEFVQVLSAHTIRARVWERGAGITLACGTGACASAVAALATQRVQSPVEVQLPGGNLSIRWDGDQGSVFMQGPAKEVYRGEIDSQ